MERSSASSLLCFDRDSSTFGTRPMKIHPKSLHPHSYDSGDHHRQGAGFGFDYCSLLELLVGGSHFEAVLQRGSIVGPILLIGGLSTSQLCRTEFPQEGKRLVSFAAQDPGLKR